MEGYFSLIILRNYSSDHRPVYGIYETEAHYPFITSDPLNIVEKQENGIFKLTKFTASFNYELLNEALDSQNLMLPLEINVSFYASFLKHNPCSSSFTIKNVRYR